MPKSFMLRVRLSKRQERRLKWAALNQDSDMSELIRNYLNRLPEPPQDWDESSYPEMSYE